MLYARGQRNRVSANTLVMMANHPSGDSVPELCSRAFFRISLMRVMAIAGIASANSSTISPRFVVNALGYLCLVFIQPEKPFPHPC